MTTPTEDLYEAMAWLCARDCQSTSLCVHPQLPTCVKQTRVKPSKEYGKTFSYLTLLVTDEVAKEMHRLGLVRLASPKPDPKGWLEACVTAAGWEWFLSEEERRRSLTHAQAAAE